VAWLSFILSITVTAAMLEVYYVEAAELCKINLIAYAC